MNTLPARLLSDIDDLLSAVPAKIHDETRWVRDACAALREAAAALSGRVPEGDMARALEWVRAMVGDNAGSRMHLPAIEEAIVAYDPARAGARSGKGVTPPPGDGVVVPRALLEQVDSALMWDLHRRPYKHRVAQQKLIDLIREYAPAAPSAKGVA